MTAVLRPAEPGDLDDMVALENAIFPDDAWSRQSFERELANPHCSYLVLVPEGEDRPVLGYGGLLASPPDGDIQTVALAEDLRGRGLGRVLVRALLDEAERKGVTSVFLEVRADNAVAQALYASMGFEALGVRPRYYKGGIDAVTMRRTAPEPQYERREPVPGPEVQP
ncbi:MAG TPA: ribosomal protein S18-alanine N-acetyltransferase [Naasia sp.]|jgi:ribosomal-protein-alanine acetyltransferase